MHQKRRVALLCRINSINVIISNIIGIINKNQFLRHSQVIYQAANGLIFLHLHILCRTLLCFCVTRDFQAYSMTSVYKTCPSETTFCTYECTSIWPFFLVYKKFLLTVEWHFEIVDDSLFCPLLVVCCFYLEASCVGWLITMSHIK